MLMPSGFPLLHEIPPILTGQEHHNLAPDSIFQLQALKIL